MIYKKGSIVPRRLVRCKHRKTQHLWKFGCDVEVTGPNVVALSAGVIFNIERFFTGGKKGKPKVYAHSCMKGVSVICLLPNGYVFQG